MERAAIYGGTGGIVLPTARALRARGATLHLVGRDVERLETAAAELGETGFTAGDVTDPDLFPRVAEAVGGRLGGLVYAVGTTQLAPLAKLGPARIEADFRINALGAFLAIQAAAPALKAGAGRGGAGVVLFSTVAAAQGFSHRASVAMAKGAVEGLALSRASASRRTPPLSPPSSSVPRRATSPGR